MLFRSQPNVCSSVSRGWIIFCNPTGPKKNGKKRSIKISSFAVKNFMDFIKKDLGGDSFKTFLGVKGKITLIFVIDNTGSMADEIAAAKAIAKSIVNQPRKEAVNYILSPFNDPSKCLESIQLSLLK